MDNDHLTTLFLLLYNSLTRPAYVNFFFLEFNGQGTLFELNFFLKLKNSVQEEVQSAVLTFSKFGFLFSRADKFLMFFIFFSFSYDVCVFVL